MLRNLVKQAFAVMGALQKEQARTPSARPFLVSIDVEESGHRYVFSTGNPLQRSAVFVGEFDGMPYGELVSQNLEHQFAYEHKLQFVDGEFAHYIVKDKFQRAPQQLSRQDREDKLEGFANGFKKYFDVHPPLQVSIPTHFRDIAHYL